MTVLEATLGAFAAGLRSRPYRSGELVTVPIATSARNLIQIYVERIDERQWLVSDMGRTASELALLGVDLDNRRVARESWHSMIAQSGLHMPILHDHGAYEIVGIVEDADLGSTVLNAADTAARGEMLRVLAPGFRAQRFSEVILASAGAHNLTFTPNAAMPTRHGGSRHVTVRVDGSRKVYMQAISSKATTLDGFDKAQAMFASSNVPQGGLVAVVADGLRLDNWQWQTLQDSGVPIRERDLDAYMQELAA